MTRDAAVLFWGWGRPGCRISTSAGQVTEWEGCSTAKPPTEAEYASAVEAYAAPERLLRERAAEILGGAAGLQAVLGVLNEAQAVAALGLSLENWTFQGMLAEVRGKGRGKALEERFAQLEAVLGLRTAWDLVVYHCGGVREADELWPHLYAAVAEV